MVRVYCLWYLMHKLGGKWGEVQGKGKAWFDRDWVLKGQNLTELKIIWVT